MLQTNTARPTMGFVLCSVAGEWLSTISACIRVQSRPEPYLTCPPVRTPRLISKSKEDAPHRTQKFAVKVKSNHPLQLLAVASKSASTCARVSGSGSGVATVAADEHPGSRNRRVFVFIRESCVQVRLECDPRVELERPRVERAPVLQAVHERFLDVRPVQRHEDDDQGRVDRLRHA